MLLTVDVTSEVLREAVELGCQLIVSHHPMFLRGAFEFSDLGFKGANSSFAIRNNLAVFSAHTNADFQVDGVTQSLAKALGLQKLSPLATANNHVVIGQTPKALTLLDFARSVAKRIPAVAQGVKVSGDPERLISKVAVLAGAGMVTSSQSRNPTWISTSPQTFDTIQLKIFRSKASWEAVQHLWISRTGLPSGFGSRAPSRSLRSSIAK